jgi:acetyl esterase/lipase
MADLETALVYHAGGLVSGSEAFVPQPQVDYLCSKGLVVVLPNYRLVPQATGKDAFADCEDAYEWATSNLPGIMRTEHGLGLDSNRVVVMGHSSGGSMTMHLAATKPIKAGTAFCPFIYISDTSTSAHKPTNAPPIGEGPPYVPSAEDRAILAPEGLQVTETPSPFERSHPRSRYASHVLRSGEWMKLVAPDGDFAAIDPMAKISGDWAPLMLVHGSEDYIPGRSLELMDRAVKDLKTASVQVELEVVDGQGHLFDHNPAIGRSDLGPAWQSVLRGLDWIVSRV